MRSIIFYGAGKYAEQNLQRWTKAGIVPVCFVDSSEEKHGQTLSGYTIYSLDKAVSRYPDYEIYLTVGLELLGKVTKYLLDKNIPQDRINYPDPVETRQGCKFIATRIQFFGGSFGTCCARRHKLIPCSDDFDENIENYKIFTNAIISGLRSGETSACDGCAMLRHDIWPKEPRLEVIGFDTAFKEDKCNFNCIYCDAKKYIEEKMLHSSLIDMMRNFEQTSKGEHRNIVLASGEISVSPYRDEVFDIIKNNQWDLHVFTNASVYNQKLADLMHMGRAKIQVSMDAGTSATFAKIKGVDCWDKVVSNLLKYADNTKSPGQIELKYILLPDINDNESDVDGFAELAAKLRADTLVSSNMNFTDKPLPDKTYNCALRLRETCRTRGIGFSLVPEFFNQQSFEMLNSTFSSAQPRQT